MFKKIILLIIFFSLFALPILAAEALNPGVSLVQKNINLSSSELIPSATKSLNVLASFLAVGAILIIIYAGIRWTSSGGDATTILKAKKTLVSGAIGLTIIVSSWGITYFVVSKMIDGSGGGSNTTDSSHFNDNNNNNGSDHYNGGGGNPPCTPNCSGKTCGDDGCGNSCGSCSLGSSCLDGNCTPPAPSCTPNCNGKTCGDDSCGGSCGACDTGYSCNNNQCQVAIFNIKYTAGANGYITGQLNQSVEYSKAGTQVIAYPNSGYLFKNWSDNYPTNYRAEYNVKNDINLSANFSCIPKCVGKNCGDDGCGNGGLCGTCDNGITCSSKGVCQTPLDCGTSFTDSRDGQSYPVIKLGEQCWMAKNLAYLPSVFPAGASLPGGDLNNPYYYVLNYSGTNVAAAQARNEYSTYGVLYNTGAALISCPAGWHLPSTTEFSTMFRFAAGISDYSQVGKILKTTGWDGSDDLGFKVLPAGCRWPNTGYFGAGNYAWLWTSNQSGTGLWVVGMQTGTNATATTTGSKDFGVNVRCVRD